MPVVHELVEEIQSRDDLVRFVRALRQDLLSSPDKWENDTLDRYLEALSAWVNDMDGFFLNRGEVVPEQPTWQVIGYILMAASMYE